MNTTTNAKLLPNSWIIYLLWTGATVVSISSSVFMGTALNSFLWVHLLFNTTKKLLISRAIVDGLIIGIIIGFSQWRVLQKLKLKWRGWMLASIIGWSIGVTFTQALDSVNWSWVMCRFIAGAIIGFPQWIILRNYLPKAYWWIINNSIGYYIIASWLPLPDAMAMTLESFTDLIFPAFILGLTTSATLSYLLVSSSLERSKSI